MSISYGVDEFAGEAADDNKFTTPLGHQGVTFVAAAGDNGIYSDVNLTTIDPDYPAVSPNVVAVGGTNLQVAGTTYLGETAWGDGTSSGQDGGGGGGVSAFEPALPYAAAASGGFSTTKRAYPDVAMDGDPATGVAVVDSYSTGSATSPWLAGRSAARAWRPRCSAGSSPSPTRPGPWPAGGPWTGPARRCPASTSCRTPTSTTSRPGTTATPPGPGST